MDIDLRFKTRITCGLVLVGSLLALPALAQGSAVLIGKVTDASSKASVSDVVVTATSPSLQGEQIVVTDATGTYRIPNLPAGTYSIRFEKETFRPYSRADIQLRTDRTTRLNVEMLPEALRSEDIVVVGQAPTIDVGSSATGVNVGAEFINNIAVVRPGGKNSSNRSFESLAEIAPGAHSDLYGVSVNGTTSPENQYVIDGLSVNDTAYGILGTPLTVEFVKEVNVITGGYMPEYGRATGGIMNVVTKSGSNEFHGSIFGAWTPGALQGSQRAVLRQGASIVNEFNLWNQADFGAELGGPIMKDRLWFYAGFAPAFHREQVLTSFNRLQACTAEDISSGAFGCSADQLTRLDDVTQFSLTDTIRTRSLFADQRTFQYIGKLTYLVNQDHNISVSLYGAPSTSGGDNKFGLDDQDGLVEISRTSQGDVSALAHRYNNLSNDVSLKYSGAFLDKRFLLDVTGGWHHQQTGRLPSDGSEVGSTEGLAGQASILYRRAGFHSLPEFTDIPASECTAVVAGEDVDLCPVTSGGATYLAGGPDFIDDKFLDRYQGKAVGTLLINALGHHVWKAGIDLESMSYEHTKAYSGTRRFRESGANWDYHRMFAYLTGPNTAVVQAAQTAGSTSFTVGGFLQDSWSVLDLFTLNAGVRWDQQTLTGDDGEVGMVLGNQWSPRIGVIYDFTQEGRSKIYANYARFYESVPLDLVDRQFPGERQLFVRVRGTACDPTDPNQVNTVCRIETLSEGERLANTVLLGAGTPDPSYILTGGEKSPVDPDLIPQSSDEFVVGAEYEVIPDARVGASYTRRYMNAVIEDMSRDEAATYFIGNPGYGIASDFPKAVRDYDAVTVYFNKNFADLWLAQVSYTWSRLFGNYAGLFRPETGQLDPNINSDFDLISLLDNRMGPLPGDRTHSFKAFGAKEFALTGAMSLNVGLSYRARSGVPISYLGSHAVYGSDEVFILPRGAGGRLPWRHEIDGHVGYTLRLSRNNALTVSADVFNLFNFQSAIQVDERYTNEDVLPVTATSGSNEERLQQVEFADGSGPLDATLINPNYGRVRNYQPPRIIRFGAKVTF